MLPFRRLLHVALVLATTPPGAALARDHVVGPLRIADPWVRPPPNGAPTAAGYLTITNTGPQPDRLVGGSTAAAQRIEVHEMSMAGGVMRMRLLAQGVALPPGATVRLEPGGDHLMFIGPKATFKAGEHIPATLRFARAGAVQVEFSVQASPPAAETPAPMGRMDMH